MDNILLMQDSYKCSHPWQYEPGMTNLFSYLESRGGKFKKTLFFGLQYTLKKYLSRPIVLADVEEAARFFKLHGEPFPEKEFRDLVFNNGGRLPIRIRAVPEGMIVPVHNVLMTVESLDPNIPWIVSFLETMLMRAVWYTTTVATLSWHIKQDIMKVLKETSDDPDSEIAFKLNDFGSRGVSSLESSACGGAAHFSKLSRFR